MHQKRILLVIVFFMLIFGYGCLTVGKRFYSDDLSWIVNNRTTKDDVYDELGEPFRVGSDAGKLTWTYGYYKYNLFGSTRTKDLIFYFNRNGSVESYVFNTSFPEEKEVWQNR